MEQELSAEKPPKVPFLVARNWQGMTFPVWLRLLAQYRFAIDPQRIPLALRITIFSLFNSGLAWWERQLYGDSIKRSKLRHPPLFVIGHWRTGTTWLHELLAQDPRFSYPTTYQCMAPHHFRSTQDIAPRLFPYMLPERRPMDNMAVGWHRPQEDEFALCNLGLPSPYLRWAFPNSPDRFDRYLDFEGVPRREKERWQQGIRRFLEHLASADPRRVVLKSPTHTARVGLLLEVFPGAQFVHIVRDPRAVFPSTVRTWKRLWNMMGLQVPHYAGIEEMVFQTFLRMYRKFEADRRLLKPGQLVEVRYEDLRADLMGQMRRIYDQLKLGEFDTVVPALERYAAQTKDYKTNVFEASEELQARILERWGDYARRYGYV